MKKLILLLAVLVLPIGRGITAEAAEPNHLMDIGTAPGWGNNVVYWNGSIGFYNDSKPTVEYIRSLLTHPTREDMDDFFRPTSPLICIGSWIIAIDGVVVNDMEKRIYTHHSELYRRLESKGPHTIRLGHPFKGEYEVVTTGTIPAWMTAQGFHPLTCRWTNRGHGRSTYPSNVKIRMDENVDWKKFKTFDYVITSNDVLLERDLLAKIASKFAKAGMKRDEENPDIVFSIVKDANQSIDYTYVPKTEQQVMTGSESKAIYGWKGSYLGSVTSNQYKTVTSGGYTQKTASTSAYLEVNVLETSRIGEKVIPLIWQMKYHYNANAEVDVEKVYENAIDWVKHPVMDMRATMDSETVTRYFYDNMSMINMGVILDARSEVIGLDPKSSLVKSSGLKVGDIIKKIDVTKVRSLDANPKTSLKGTLVVERNGVDQTLKFSNVWRVNSYKPIKYYSAYTPF